MTPSHDLTQVIPTHNRSRYLRRLLQLLSQTQCPNDILVIDSSFGKEKILTECVIEEFRHKLKLTHRHDLEDFTRKCSQALQQVQTSYTVFCADDDFQISASLTTACQFLDANPDYGSCMGHALFVLPSTPVTLTRQSWSTIALQSPSQRVQAISLDGNYAVFYAVHRTELLLDRFCLARQSCEYTRSRVLPEILLCQLCALRGKLKVLGDTMTIRQVHPGNESSHTPCIQETSTFAQDYRSYRDCLAQQLQEHANLSNEEAVRFADQVFADYDPRLNLQRSFLSGFQRRISRVFRERRRRKLLATPKKGRKQQLSTESLELQTTAIQQSLDLMVSHPEGLPREQSKPNAA